tara:strand:- start:16 stop:495 length:480 start_codon:yes stop_codon:yes gene_type:complete
MNNECHELKNIKYKSMLLTGNIEEKQEIVENLSNMDSFLEHEKKNISNEPWTKLDKTTKLMKFNDFVNNYTIEQEYSELNKNELMNFLSTTLDSKRLLKAKEVIYNKENGKITSIPSLVYNNTSKKFTLKRCDKRPSTLKSLAPKKNKNKKNDKIDINN